MDPNANLREQECILRYLKRDLNMSDRMRLRELRQVLTDWKPIN